MNVLPRTGRPSEITAELGEVILEYSHDNPFSSARKIQADLELDICQETIRRFLKKANLHARIPAVKPTLTEEHKRQRRIFARKYLERDLD